MRTEETDDIDVTDVEFNPNMFNNVFWHLRKAFDNLALRFIWLYGGSSASKTYSAVQLIIMRMMENEDENTLVLRKFGTDIRDTIYQDFKTIIKEWDLEDQFTIQVNYIKCNATGSFVRFRGMDDSEKIKGISAFRRVVLEEVSQFDEVDLKQIRKRLRGRVGQQIVAIFNPISEEHWIKKNVFDRELLTPVVDFMVEVADDNGDLYTQSAPIAEMQYNSKGNTLIMKTNYLDNIFIVGKWLRDEKGGLAVGADGKLIQIGGFVDQHTIDDFEKDKEEDENYYQVYGLGNWGKLRTGGEFWKDFKYDRNTTRAGYNPSLPIFLWWDENVNPFLTCLVFQIYNADNNIMRNGVSLRGKKVAVQIDEVCLEHPRNTQRDVCAEVLKRYPGAVLTSGFYGGDRTSLKEDTKLEKGENFYTKINEYLADLKLTLRMQSVNPSVVQSKNWINEVFRGNDPGVMLFINVNCSKSLNDYQYCLEDSDGGVAKTKKKHPVTKVTYEEYGHPSDALRYFMTVNFAGEYAKYMAGGRKQLPYVGKNISKNKV